MKITYNQNPLFTTIELDESEKKELWYKIKIEELMDILSEAEFQLSDPKYFNLEKTSKLVNSDYYSSDDGTKSKIDIRCDMIFNSFLESLGSSHIGDCTCMCCSCMKCHAETMLGINTKEGLDNHSGHNIFAAFGGNKNDKTIDEAIEYLSSFKINADDYQTENWKKLGGHEQYIPRWTEQTKKAHEWLVNYKQKHFKD